jgi:BirA family biotin operon repressor/biotin-[acetyl-CoA-carboxylase] ligase
MAFSLGPRATSAGYRLAAFDHIGSTNAEALTRIGSGVREPTWFVTSEQTAGRGRRQRTWFAPRGNLASSVVEVMDVSPTVAATLGFVAGVALERTVRSISIEASVRSGVAIDYALKWPNDVLANKQKLTGIALEAEMVGDGRLAVVVGIGTNVIAAPEGTPFPATSLRALGVEVSAEDVFSVLSDAWADLFPIWDSGRGFAEIRRLWLDRAAGLDQPVSIRSGTGVITGTFETIDDSGCMVIETSGGKRETITAGDVYFGSAASAGAT